MLVYKYGIIMRSAETPVLQDELMRITKHWNALVEAEYNRRRAFRQVCCDHLPDYAAAQVELERIKPEIDALYVEIKDYRMKNRTKEISDELAARKKALLDERSGYCAIIKTETKKLPKELGASVEKDFWRQAKAAYQNSGCHWGNKDETAQCFAAARQKAMQDKGNLKLREYDGTGVLTQRLRKDGVNVTVAEFLSQKPMQVCVTGEGKAWEKPLLPIAFTYFVSRTAEGKRQPEVLLADIIYHRPMPENGEIKKVQLIKRKTEQGRVAWFISITVDEKTELRHEKANASGINLNFRKFGERLRVATVVNASGGYQHYLMPAELTARFQTAEKLHGLADDAWNELEDYLKTLQGKER